MRFSRPHRLRGLWLLAAFATSALASPMHPTDFQDVLVQNTVPRRDTDDAIIDAHDGCLQFFAGRYYLYGTAYGRSAGFGLNNRYRVYSSADLGEWRYEGELLADQPAGVFYRPYVVFNPQTRLYVLWFNWYPQLWDGATGVAVSETPVGPFRIVASRVGLSQAADRPGDGSLFVDDDGTGYYIHTVIGQGHAIRIEKLTADFLGSTGKVSEVLARGCEAPALFRRGDLYYALFDTACCFCPQGSGARVYTARQPLGPYTFQGNLNRDAQDRPIIAAQQTYVARLPGPQGDVYLWMGDRWGSRPDGIKGHDFQYWSAPLQFATDGKIQPLSFTAEWRTALRRGQPPVTPPHRYTQPKRPDPNPVTTDPCTRQPIPVENQDRGW